MIALVSQNPKLVMFLLLIGAIIALSHLSGETVPDKRADL